MNPVESKPSWWDRLPPSTAALLSTAFSLVAGLAVAFLLHYLLYRFALPSKPFIYVAF
jgi:hypothetical protein